jgi:hypothetical protein
MHARRARVRARVAHLCDMDLGEGAAVAKVLQRARDPSGPLALRATGVHRTRTAARARKGRVRAMHCRGGWEKKFGSILVGRVWAVGLWYKIDQYGVLEILWPISRDLWRGLFLYWRWPLGLLNLWSIVIIIPPDTSQIN